MEQAKWYELRVAGSAGTSSEISGSIAIAIAENGRLCSIFSGAAKRFETEQAVMDYLFISTVPALPLRGRVLWLIVGRSRSEPMKPLITLIDDRQPLRTRL
jgi:hypothetical protein